MDAINPYAAPETFESRQLLPAAKRRLGYVHAFRIVAISGVVCCVFGGVLGLLIGGLAPDYYRAVFGQFDNPNFSPIQVGFGLGITQGLAGGCVLGVIVLLAVAIAGRLRR